MEIHSFSFRIEKNAFLYYYYLFVRSTNTHIAKRILCFVHIFVPFKFRILNLSAFSISSFWKRRFCCCCMYVRMASSRSTHTFIYFFEIVPYQSALSQQEEHDASKAHFLLLHTAYCIQENENVRNDCCGLQLIASIHWKCQCLKCEEWANEQLHKVSR